MIDFGNFEVYGKFILAIIGALVTFNKIKDSFASSKRKQELSLDLDILKKLKENSLDYQEIEFKIKQNLEKTYSNFSENLTDFFVGVSVFVGFGFWTIDLVKNSVDFNGWSILTLFLCTIGFSMILDSGNNNYDDEKEEGKKVFFAIGFRDKQNIIFAVCGIIFSASMSIILFNFFDKHFFWKFTSILFSVIGFISLIKRVKRLDI